MKWESRQSYERMHSMSVCVCVCKAEYGELKFDSSQFAVTAMLHPRGLVNVVLFASRQGRLQLWNVNTSRLLYTFSGWDAAVTALQQVTSRSTLYEANSQVL